MGWDAVRPCLALLMEVQGHPETLTNRENQLFLSLLLTSSCRVFILRVMMTNIRRMASRRSLSEVMPRTASWALCSKGNTARIHQDQAGPLGLLCKRNERKTHYYCLKYKSVPSVLSFVSPTDIWARIKRHLLIQVYFTIHSALEIQFTLMLHI